MYTHIEYNNHVIETWPYVDFVGEGSRRGMFYDVTVDGEFLKAGFRQEQRAIGYAQAFIDYVLPTI